MKVGENIKRIRLEKKLSRRELSEITGLSQGYIAQVENSLRNPTLDTLKKIAKGLNVRLEFLTSNSNTNEIKTFGAELDRMCNEVGIDTSLFDEEDLERVTAKIMLLLKKISNEKNAE
ncbi:helix-turn-helix domain-containing protein [Clostridium perfringens]|uniref:Helix-turn-helix transcriptional regulator n=1 Tax=Clostridium perfringens TaxID=1502 RepID=A0AAP4A8R0_CLOPF|nr:helix-turn-helix transcriptional regulator [Clostridium perfringens]MDH2337342.1 helix-turn-helix transcriptional regulator [Clostridium perfringens]